jgi:hypothetical protein
MVRRIKGRRPSPAMIVAGAALVFALAGTAIAGPIAIKSVLNKQEKKQVKAIAKNQVNNLAPGLSVAKATTATNATNATNANNANTLDNLEPSELSPAVGVNRTSDLTLTDSFQTVTADNITVAATSRLVGNAAMHLDGDGGGNDRGDCQFRFSGVAGIGYSSDIPINDETMPVTGTTTVGPGTHSVLVECLRNVAGSVIVRNASMTVTAHLEE